MATLEEGGEHRAGEGAAWETLAGESIRYVARSREGEWLGQKGTLMIMTHVLESNPGLESLTLST